MLEGISNLEIWLTAATYLHGIFQFFSFNNVSLIEIHSSNLLRVLEEEIVSLCGSIV